MQRGIVIKKIVSKFFSEWLKTLKVEKTNVLRTNISPPPLGIGEECKLLLLGISNNNFLKYGIKNK